jgi:hypothetical protein
MKKHTKAFADLTSAIEAYQKANGNPAPIYVLYLSNFGNHWGLERVAASSDIQALWGLFRSWHLMDDVASVEDFMATHNKVEIQLKQQFTHKWFNYNKVVIERIPVIF